MVALLRATMTLRREAGRGVAERRSGDNVRANTAQASLWPQPPCSCHTVSEGGKEKRGSQAIDTGRMRGWGQELWDSLAFSDYKSCVKSRADASGGQSQSQILREAQTEVALCLG